MSLQNPSKCNLIQNFFQEKSIHSKIERSVGMKGLSRTKTTFIVRFVSLRKIFHPVSSNFLTTVVKNKNIDSTPLKIKTWNTLVKFISTFFFLFSKRPNLHKSVGSVKFVINIEDTSPPEWFPSWALTNVTRIG